MAGNGEQWTGNGGAASLRLSAGLLLSGQLLFIVITLLHADGPANNHPVVFAEYAASGTWKLVHLGQFFSMAVLLGGLFALDFALEARSERTRWASRFGAALTVVTLALYGVLQAVDGIANKQAVDAWVSAADAEKAARFASAEAIRWLEWGVRSYQNVTLGLALLLFAAAVIRTPRIARPLGYLMGLSGVSYLVQGWVVGAQGFSGAETIAIEVAYVLDVLWMIWLLVVAWRTQDSAPVRPS
jgi:hypothetical protein